MSKRAWLAVGLMMAAVAAGVFIAMTGASFPSEGNLRVDPVASAWPTDQARTWSFSLPKEIPSGSELSLRIRARPSMMAPNTTVSIGAQVSAMSPGDAQREFGTGMLHFSPEISVPETGKATVQILDLSRIGAVSVKPGQNLRILANVAVGGSRVDLAGDDIFLPAGRVAGWTVNAEGKWTNGDLYLMTFLVQREQEKTQYDVLLTLRTPRPNVP